MTLETAIKIALQRPSARDKNEIERMVKDILYSILTAQAKLALQHSYADAVNLAYDVSTAQYDAGNINANEASEHQVEMEAALLETAKTQDQLLLLREEMNSLLKLFGTDTHWCIPGDLPKIDFAEPDIKEISDNPSPTLISDYHLLMLRHGVVDYFEETVLPTAEQRLALAQQAYNSRAIGIYDLLAAKKEILMIQIDFHNVLRDYWYARSAIEETLGMPLAKNPHDIEASATSFEESNAYYAPLTLQPTPIPTQTPPAQRPSYVPVEAPNTSTLSWVMQSGIKVFQLVAEPIVREVAPGMLVKCWGYNGQTPGPVIEAVQGDRVRILVTNHLAVPTSIHWHGLIVPNAMDGVAGLTQRPIQPNETFAYEFTVQQNGTFMYHAPIEDRVQINMGLMGFLIVHPKINEQPTADRDFAIFMHEWSIPVGAMTPNTTAEMPNVFTFNGRVSPGTAPLVVRKGQRVRIRLANLGVDSQPIHLHGHNFRVISHGIGRLNWDVQPDEMTVDVPCGSVREIEFVANQPGDWSLHSDISARVINSVRYGLPNLLDVDQAPINDSLDKLIPPSKKGLPNVISSMRDGPFGPIKAGGMSTLLKVRENITRFTDPGWYQQPQSKPIQQNAPAQQNSPASSAPNPATNQPSTSQETLK
jgi:hypothetical protein